MSDNQTLVYKKKKKKFKVFPIVNAILFIIIACAIMIPIYKVIITSIDAYSSYDFRWLPQKFSWGGYRAIVTSILNLSYNNSCWYIRWTFSCYTWRLCINSVGDARKKLLRLYASLHNDFRWWYDS